MLLGAIIFLQYSLTQVTSAKCYAASMEGGGPCGAYEAGAMVALTEATPLSELKYNVIGGISIGSYNTCWCAGFKLGDERNMALNLKRIWLSVNSTNEIFKPWGFLSALFFRPGLVNNSPALDFIAKEMQSNIVRNVTVGATNINTGNLENFNETLGPEYLPKACFASGAYGGAFPPVNFLDEWYVDGCATANMNSFIIIDKCREYGYDDKDIVVDLYYDVYLNVMPDNRMNNTKQTVTRLNAIREFYKAEWFISQMYNNFPDVDFRYITSPSQELSMDFSNKNFRFEIDLGYNDTMAMLKKPQSERRSDFKKKFEYNPHF